MKDNYNIFSNTPIPKDKNTNALNKNYCIFKKNEIKGKNAVKIKSENNNNLNQNKINFNAKNIYNHNKKEDNNGFNDINMKNSSNVKYNSKTVVNKKKNLLKESLDLNMMDYKGELVNMNNGNNNINNNNISNIKKNNNINNDNNINNNINNDNNIKNNINIKNNNNINNNIINNIKNNNININNINHLDNIADANNKNIHQNLNNNNNNINQNIDEKKIISNELNNNEDNDKKNIIKNKVKKKYNPEDIKKKKQKEESSRAQIQDVFKCYICLSKLINPRMCKFCKKLSCEKCLKNWLETKNKCGFCRSQLTFKDTISIPFLDEMSSFFIEEVEKKPSNDNINYSISTQSEEIIGENSVNCYEHHSPYEYYCVQCNKNYCIKCFMFINESSKIHEKHFILPLKNINNNEIKEIINEYQKLNNTKENIDELMNICNVKIKELELEKNQNLKALENIKNDIKQNFNEKLQYYKNDYNNLKLKKDELDRAIETTPNALKNLVKVKDHGQGEQIYKHINNLNLFIDNVKEIKKINYKNYFIENYESEQFEFLLPQNGRYVENLEIFKKIINNLIPDSECKIGLYYEYNKVKFILKIKKLKNMNNNDKIKYYGFIIITNKSYDCELILYNNIYNEKHYLYGEINSQKFLSFKDKNNKISFRIYIMKHESL